MSPLRYSTVCKIDEPILPLFVYRLSGCDNRRRGCLPAVHGNYEARYKELRAEAAAPTSAYEPALTQISSERKGSNDWGNVHEWNEQTDVITVRCIIENRSGLIQVILLSPGTEHRLNYVLNS